MKKLLIITCFFSISLYSGCGKCDDCGPLGLAKYGLINTLDHELELEFHGTEFWSQNYGFDSFEFNLHPKDTSKIWVLVPDPVGRTAFDYVFTTGNRNDSFPLEADSVLIKIDNNLIKTFRRKSDELEQDHQSIFSWIAFDQLDNEEHSPLFYKLDSVNLDLK